MNVFLLLVLFGGIVIFEVPGLIYRKYWKELIVFFLLLGFAFIISFLVVLDITIPSPARGIEVVITYILKIIGI